MPDTEKLLEPMASALASSVPTNSVPTSVATAMPNMPAAHSETNQIQFDPSQLADIQLPETIHLWPPAPGWWLLLALFFILLSIIIYFIKRKPVAKKAKAKHLKSQAMIELQSIQEHYETHQDEQQKVHESVKHLSVFLRRYILSLYSREQVASLTDQQWLLLLDKTYQTSLKKTVTGEAVTLFSEKYSDLLTQVPYQANTMAIDETLLQDLFASSKLLINNSAQLFNKHSSSHPLSKVLQ